MDLILQREQYREDGIFGKLFDLNGRELFVTLEHAYEDGPAGLVPKVAVGTYNCVRHSPNRLPYETFMLENVPDFQGAPVTGILIHRGNFGKDSEGCILLGQKIMQLGFGQEMIGGSKAAFEDFMALQVGFPSFSLQISA